MTFFEALANWFNNKPVKTGVVTASGPLPVSMADLVKAHWAFEDDAEETPEVKYLGGLLKVEKRRAERLQAELDEAKRRLAEIANVVGEGNE
jgi:hypothetical protein